MGLLNLLPATNSGLAYGLGYAGGYMLNTAFLKKYLPDEASYPRKSWVKPLLIWLAVAALLVWLVVTQTTVLADGLVAGATLASGR